MGFEAKMIIVCKSTAKTEKKGPQGQEECVVWTDTHFTINFEHITRLEKVVGERFKHLEHTSFRRAGICVADCLLDYLFADLEKRGTERVAPEILVNKNPFRERGTPTTEKVGGRTYIDCQPHRLEGGIVGADELIDQHNKAITLDEAGFSAYLEKHSIFLDGPLLWAPCVDLSEQLYDAEAAQTEGWKALAQDGVSLAIAKGWRHQLTELGQLGARALFRFS